MRRAVLILALGCPASAATPAPTPAPVEVALQPTTTCRVEHPNVQVEWTLDAAGLPMKQYENSDAAAHQWSSLWVRDDSGRTTRIETEMLEGIGDADQTRELRYQEVEGTVVVSYEQYDEVHSARWTYDEHGRPIRHESRVGDGEPRVTTCEYDSAGRVSARGEERFGYEGDATTPSWAGSPETSVVAFRNVFFSAGPEAPYTHYFDNERYIGDCTDVFFYPCSPVFAPPPPGRRRAPRLPTSSPRPASSMQELVRRDLHCPSEVEGEERCTTQAALRAPSSESPALREVAVLTIARGESGFETTHLLLHLEDGWWLGPQLGDGPFNGNQMSGTLAFRVTEVSIETAFEGEPALVAHYESETSNEIDEQQHDVREAGLILCINLASDQLRCARVAESIHHEVDGELTEARARLRIVGDGTIAVDEVSGSHERVPREMVYIEQLYQ